MNNSVALSRVQGMTLIEVLIAVVILAAIGTISYQSLSATITSKEVVEDNLAKLARIDRTWMLIENDMRNVINHTTRRTLGPGSGDVIAPFVVDDTADYWMTMLRGGHANPLNFRRTEVIRVGYRIAEETLWRDVWYDLASTDVDQAQQQKIVEGVEEIIVRVLSRKASSFSAGPWSDRWPAMGAAPDESELPLAVELSVKLKDKAEIKRLFTLTKGE